MPLPVSVTAMHPTECAVPELLGVGTPGTASSDCLSCCCRQGETMSVAPAAGGGAGHWEALFRFAFLAELGSIPAQVQPTKPVCLPCTLPPACLQLSTHKCPAGQAKHAFACPATCSQKQPF